MNIVPNQIIELHVERDSEIAVYRTRVEDVSHNTLLVGAPLERGQVIPIRVGTEIIVQYKDDSIKTEGRFSNTAVVEKRFHESVPTLLLRLTGQWEKTQERMFVRVDVLIDAAFAPIADGNIQAVQTGTILNLSGGGLLLASDYQLAESDVIWISFPIDTKSIRTLGHVVRIRQLEDTNGYGIAFQDMDEKQRQEIIQFVYRRQLELRRLLNTERHTC